jgi:hypothetical protein
MPVYFWPSYSLNSSYETAASFRACFLSAMSDLLSAPLPRKGQTSPGLDGAGVVRPAGSAARFPPAVPVNRLRAP